MTRFYRWFQVMMAATFLGASFALPDCAGTIVRNVNPCGTILFCDPLEYDLAFMQDEFPDWDVDPTCTIPGLCGGTPFPTEPGTISGTGTILPGAGTGGTDTGVGGDTGTGG
jgi:hypothetical protein